VTKVGDIGNLGDAIVVPLVAAFERAKHRYLLGCERISGSNANAGTVYARPENLDRQFHRPDFRLVRGLPRLHRAHTAPD
jgi:hypothetical protein